MQRSQQISWAHRSRMSAVQKRRREIAMMMKRANSDED
jgi:hypothetical protein